MLSVGKELVATAPAAGTPQRVGPQSAPLSLRRNFLWTFAGNVIYAACQWGVLVCLAKLGSPEVVGQFGLGLAITAPVIIFTQLQLRAVQATDSKREFAIGEYLALRLVMTAAAIIVIVGLALAGSYSHETVVVILAIGVGKAVESIADVYYGFFQQHERMDCIAKAMMLQGALALLGAGVGMAIAGSVAWAAAGWAAAAVGSLGLYTLRSAKRLAGGLEYRVERSGGVRRLGELAWLALPLGVVMMLISLQTNIPRYYLEAYRGEAELGIYTAVAYLMVVGNFVIQALGQSATPRLTRYQAAGDRGAFGKLLGKLLGIGLLFGIGGLLFVTIAAAPLLRWLYTEDYAEHVGVLAILMLAAAIGYLASFLGYGMTAARAFRSQVPLFLVVAAVTAVACQAWIPRWGMSGAAWALTVAAGVQLGGSALVVLLACRKSREGAAL